MPGETATYQDGGQFHTVALWEKVRPKHHFFMDARSKDSRLPLAIVSQPGGDSRLACPPGGAPRGLTLPYNL